MINLSKTFHPLLFPPICLNIYFEIHYIIILYNTVDQSNIMIAEVFHHVIYAKHEHKNSLLHYDNQLSNFECPRQLLTSCLRAHLEDHPCYLLWSACIVII